jgi:hypothetical protein
MASEQAFDDDQSLIGGEEYDGSSRPQCWKTFTPSRAKSGSGSKLTDLDCPVAKEETAAMAKIVWENTVKQTGTREPDVVGESNVQRR